MPQAAPAAKTLGNTLGTIATIGSAVSGIQAGQRAERAAGQAERLTAAEEEELRQVRAILSDPTNPVRAMLRAQAEAGIGRQVTGAQQGLLSRLASAGFRAPETLAGPLGAIAARGTAAQGDLERQLITNFIQQRANLLGRGADIGRLGLDISNIAGLEAEGGGESLARLLELLRRSPRTAGYTGAGINPYAGIGPGGLPTYRAAGRRDFYMQ